MAGTVTKMSFYLTFKNISVPTQLFTGDCESKDVTFVGTASDHFPDPGTKNPTYFTTNRAVLVR